MTKKKNCVEKEQAKGSTYDQAVKKCKHVNRRKIEYKIHRLEQMIKNEEYMIQKNREDRNIDQVGVHIERKDALKRALELFEDI